MLSKQTQWEKDMSKGTKVFNFILFHRGTIEHVPQHFDILIKEIQTKFYSQLIRLTAFWNFVALGHQNSQMTTMQKRDFSSIIPGVKLFLFEPAVSDEDPLSGDTRHHLINLLYTNTLPFQLIKITT